jgi:hypothetical protein
MDHEFQGGSKASGAGEHVFARSAVNGDALSGVTE